MPKNKPIKKRSKETPYSKQEIGTITSSDDAVSDKYSTSGECSTSEDGPTEMEIDMDNMHIESEDEKDSYATGEEGSDDPEQEGQLVSLESGPIDSLKDLIIEVVRQENDVHLGMSYGYFIENYFELQCQEFEHILSTINQWAASSQEQLTDINYLKQIILLARLKKICEKQKEYGYDRNDSAKRLYDAISQVEKKAGVSFETFYPIHPVDKKIKENVEKNKSVEMIEHVLQLYSELYDTSYEQLKSRVTGNRKAIATEIVTQAKETTLKKLIGVDEISIDTEVFYHFLGQLTLVDGSQEGFENFILANNCSKFEFATRYIECLDVLAEAVKNWVSSPSLQSGEKKNKFSSPSAEELHKFFEELKATLKVQNFAKYKLQNDNQDKKTEYNISDLAYQLAQDPNYSKFFEFFIMSGGELKKQSKKQVLQNSLKATHFFAQFPEEAFSHGKKNHKILFLKWLYLLSIQASKNGNDTAKSMVNAISQYPALLEFFSITSIGLQEQSQINFSELADRVIRKIDPEKNLAQNLEKYMNISSVRWRSTLRWADNFFRGAKGDGEYSGALRNLKKICDGELKDDPDAKEVSALLGNIQSKLPVKKQEEGSLAYQAGEWIDKIKRAYDKLGREYRLFTILNIESAKQSIIKTLFNPDELSNTTKQNFNGKRKFFENFYQIQEISSYGKAPFSVKPFNKPPEGLKEHLKEIDSSFQVLAPLMSAFTLIEMIRARIETDRRGDKKSFFACFDGIKETPLKYCIRDRNINKLFSNIFEKIDGITDDSIICFLKGLDRVYQYAIKQHYPEAIELKKRLEKLAYHFNLSDFSKMNEHVLLDGREKYQIRQTVLEFILEKAMKDISSLQTLFPTCLNQEDIKKRYLDLLGKVDSIVITFLTWAQMANWTNAKVVEGEGYLYEAPFTLEEINFLDHLDALCETLKSHSPIAQYYYDDLFQPAKRALGVENGASSQKIFFSYYERVKSYLIMLTGNYCEKAVPDETVTEIDIEAEQTRLAILQAMEEMREEDEQNEVRAEIIQAMKDMGGEEDDEIIQAMEASSLSDKSPLVGQSMFKRVKKGPSTSAEPTGNYNNAKGC